MATADLGVTEMCCSFESFLSPLIERRRACVRWCQFSFVLDILPLTHRIVREECMTHSN